MRGICCKRDAWLYLFTVICFGLAACSGTKGTQDARTAAIGTIAGTPGLVAFWDFQHREGSVWSSYYDPAIQHRGYPVHLRQIGDANSYTPASWPYSDLASRLVVDKSGPFGRAIRFNQGYIYGAVDRAVFDGELLDIHGEQPFTMISWCKFTGQRHMVAGIWDEGGWDKYAGRRQVALFAGLFNQDGVIAHVSATGASSFPQSTAAGAQYARLRAIDGQAFEDGEWVALAMTYDPEQGEVRAYLNGEMTPLAITDPVAQDVYQYEEVQSANPLAFAYPIYGPRAFTLKYNGYDVDDAGVNEHRLFVDLENGLLTFEQDPVDDQHAYRVSFNVLREGEPLMERPFIFAARHGSSMALPTELSVEDGDRVQTQLDVQQYRRWMRVGEVVERQVSAGAPFTFGRALGLGAGEMTHGSQLFLDGVAVFNRVLGPEELQQLSFVDAP